MILFEQTAELTWRLTLEIRGELPFFNGETEWHSSKAWAQQLQLLAAGLTLDKTVPVTVESTGEVVSD